MLGHKEGSVVIENEKKATCTEDGSHDEVVYCTVCSAELSRVPVTDTMLGHDEIAHEGKEATCTEGGWKAYVTCSRCEYTTYEAIGMLGHTEGQPVTENNTAPSCTSAGTYDVVVYCKECGTELSRETVTTSVGQHVWSDEAVTGKEPTCLEDGYDCYYCIYDCGWYKEVIVPATGHNFVCDEDCVVAPSCTNKGYTRYYCDNEGCSATEDRDFVPALDHAYEKTVIAPTCDENGYTIYTCTVCTESYIEYYKVDENGEYVYDENYEKVLEYPAEGHLDNDGDGICDHCKVDIVSACRCLCHSKNWFMRIIYIIVRFIWMLFKVNPTCSCGFTHY